MVVQKGFAFPRDEQGNAPSSGDGGDGATVPATGQRNPAYREPVNPGRLSTAGGLDSHLSRGRGSERDYREAQAASSGVLEDGGAGGFALPTDVDRFTTTGQVAANSAEQPMSTAGGSDRLVVNDTLPDDSNAQAGGRPVA